MIKSVDILWRNQAFYSYLFYLLEVVMIYFECHITIEPVFGEELENLKQEEIARWQHKLSTMEIVEVSIKLL